jgi:predicted regulator of Ras-like GTPase activity (Roadblock/LC7/MglB family)
MSLASLHRQAQGLIKPLAAGDKRSVDVPLAEVFRHLKPGAFRRREQRPIEVPHEGFNLFGDSTNPYAIAPDDHVASELAQESGSTVLDLTGEIPADAPRVLKMDEGLRAQFGNGASNGNGSHGEANNRHPRAVIPPPNTAVPTPPATVGFVAVPKPAGATLSLLLTSVAANWPENVRSEIGPLDPATQVVLPMDDLSAGLAKGRVSFSWKQIHSWLEPECTTPSSAPGDTVLPLPLKLVAPAFLAASKKPAADRKGIDMDESIPALFNDGRPPTENPPVAEAVPVSESNAEPVPEAIPEPAAEPVAGSVVEPVAETPVAETPLAAPVVVPAQSLAPAPATTKLPESIGEIFGEPHKREWTPAEIVTGTVKLPGVAGAVVALQEGLPVAISLPEGVKGEVVAAFLPQIFARLNQYAGEMRLGDVDDLLFTTHGAHCQIYRLGYIYFAVLGKAGEALPWHELHLITEELGRQTHK